MNRTWIALAAAAAVVQPIGPGRTALAGARDYFKIEDTKVVVNLQPASVLFSANSEEFAAENNQYRKDSVKGDTSYFPSGKIGIGLDTEKMQYDITVGGGYLYNNAVTGPVLLGDLSIRLKMGDVITLGPHVGPVYISSPTWKGDSDISLSGSVGVLAGLMITVGNVSGQWSVVLSADYVQCKLDAEDGAEWKATTDSFDLSGYAVQLGFMYRWDKDGIY